MIKRTGCLLFAVQLIFSSLALGAETAGNPEPEEMALYQSAYQIIEAAEKAMEAPFQSSFNPQLCLEKAKAIRSHLKKNKTVSEKFLKLLQDEAALLDMAVEYFKTVVRARPSLNTLAMSQKQYQANQLKENFKTAHAALVTRQP